MEKNKKITWAFFGSSHLSVIVLDALESLGLVPNLVVTTPDKAKGRGLEITSGPVKEWTEKRNIPVLAPASLKKPEAVEEMRNFGPWDVFLVASYGKIVPKEIFEMPSRKTLNIHPSLLPKLRGPSPIESAILREKETGVTIMQIDELVDHGPIVAAKAVPVPEWPPYYHDLEKILATEGANLFVQILPQWLEGKIEVQEQIHQAATFTSKFTKNDLCLSLDADPENNLRKIRAFSDNRGAYYREKKDNKEIRVIVIKAKIADGKLVLERVKPEGKKEMNYEDFKRGVRK